MINDRGRLLGIHTAGLDLGVLNYGTTLVAVRKMLISNKICLTHFTKDNCRQTIEEPSIPQSTLTEIEGVKINPPSSLPREVKIVLTLVGIAAVALTLFCSLKIKKHFSK